MQQRNNKDRIILGIDPGTSIMGYGAIHVVDNKMHLLSMGVLNISKISDPYTKLHKIFERVVELVDEFHPDEMSIEAPFFGKNVQSMLKLGRAQGVAMSAALTRSVPIIEYSPKKIKQSITGSGNGSKEQVALMLKSLLKIEELPKDLDATDGLAAAVCHYFQGGNSASKKSYSGWSAFVKQNPHRTKS